jgi:hypothetical protein
LEVVITLGEKPSSMKGLMPRASMASYSLSIPVQSKTSLSPSYFTVP